ncbi:MAG: hypothetical protein AAGB02_02335 [Pseudomonadota bacterium]
MALLAWVFATKTVCAQSEKSVATGAFDLGRAVSDAPAGAIIDIPGGAYTVADLKLPKTVHLRGNGDVVLRAENPTKKGIIVPLQGVSVTVENLTFRGAVSPDKNGAGIRHEGRDLTIVDCRFAENENGLLATGDAVGVISIENTEFLRNGHGDGYSHGIYVLRAASLGILDSVFSGTRIGHHVKSLADETSIQGTTFIDGDGRPSYALDASKGGRVLFADNVVEQAADASNRTIVNYDLSRGGEAIALQITDNTIVNRRARGRLLRNDTRLSPVIERNSVRNKGRGTFSLKPSLGEVKMHTRKETLAIVSEQVAPKTGRRSGLLFPPIFSRDGENAIARFKLRNNWRQDSEPDFFTFALGLAPGELNPSGRVNAKFTDRTSPAQIDVKALHDDGSVRHAVFTISAPFLPSGKEEEGILVHADETPDVKGFAPAEILEENFSFPIRMKFYFGDGSDEQISVDLQDAVVKAFAHDKNDWWLTGPYATETRIEIDLMPHLTLRADTRVYRDGDIRVSLIFSNEKTFASGRRELLYDIEIGDADNPAFTAQRIPHHRSSNWRRVFWLGSQPRLHVKHELNGLIRSRAILPFDGSLGVSAAQIAIDAQRLDGAAPMSPALLNPYFPTTGARPDIGPVPQWASRYLVTQTERSKRTMLANADAGGAVPWHFLDDETGAPISIEAHLQFWADERGDRKGHAIQPHLDLFESSDAGWAPDHAHKPALFSVPYLVTGDRYYADELAMQAAYSLFGRWPALRGGGLKAIDVEQVRASAWSLRDLSDAAWLLPESHPSKAYLSRALTENLLITRKKYVTDRFMADSGLLEGYLDEDEPRDPERISPWQNDYLATALWAASRRGNADAAKLIKWTAPFQTGRVLGDLPIAYAAPYMLPIRDASGGAPAANWRAVADRLDSARRKYGDAMLGFPEQADGYWGLYSGALTALASDAPNERTYEAMARLTGFVEDFSFWTGVEDGAATIANNFLFSLMTPGGEWIARKDFRKSGHGRARPEFLFGGDLGDRIDGAGGDDIIVGLAGDDELTGGDGDDVIVAGPGDDRIRGGPGNDRMAGGDGRNTFEFGDADHGEDEITDFNVEKDRIEFSKISTFSRVPPLSLVRDTKEGAQIALLSEGHSILLRGVPASSLSSSNFTTNQSKE